MLKETKDVGLLISLDDQVFPEGIGHLFCIADYMCVFTIDGTMEGPVGYAAVCTHEHYSDIIRIGVLERYRKRGIGRLLLLAALQATPAPWILTVERANTQALSLYRSVGFVPKGVLRDCVVMVKTSGSQ